MDSSALFVEVIRVKGETLRNIVFILGWRAWLLTTELLCNVYKKKKIKGVRRAVQ